MLTIREMFEKIKENKAIGLSAFDEVNLDLLEYDYSYCPVEGKMSRIKKFDIGNWLCTDTIVGHTLYTFDDLPLGYSYQSGRKSSYRISYFDKEVVKSARKYILSHYEKNDEPYINMMSIDDELGDGYKIHFNSQMFAHHMDNVTYNGEDVKIIEKIESENYHGIGRDIVIQFSKGETKTIEMKDLLFKWSHM